MGTLLSGATPHTTDKSHQFISELEQQQHMLEQAGIYYTDFCNFCMPTPSRKVTSKYGHRWGRKHKGLDIKVQVGDTIRAAFSGVVSVSKYDAGGYGYYIVIGHRRGLETLYGHLAKLTVRPGQRVKAGDAIGLGGNTGRSTGSHLHFETRLNGKALDPTLLFDFHNQIFCYVNSQEDIHEEKTDYQELEKPDEQKLMLLGFPTATTFSLALTAPLPIQPNTADGDYDYALSRTATNTEYIRNTQTSITNHKAQTLPTVGASGRTFTDERQYWSSSSRQHSPVLHRLG